MTSEPKLLQDKLIVITGGAGLLGQHFCNAVAQQGGNVVVADLNREKAESVADAIVRQGGRAMGRELDITSPASVQGLIDELHESQGRIDAIVNNAYPRNRNYGRRFEEVEYADMCDSLSIHLAAYFLVAQKFAEHLRNNGGGSIVNMSSIYGLIPPRFQIYAGTKMTTPIEYALIKAGVNQMTRYIAQYYKGSDVRCNTVSPGGIADKQPESFLEKYGEFCTSKGMLEPKDISGALVFLLSDAARYVNGQNLVVDDGFSL